jgi:translation initiation factor IF-1
VGSNPALKVEGTVREELPAAKFLVELADQRKVLAHAAGHRTRNFVRLVPGDRVELEISPLDNTRGRIMRKI